MHGPRAGPRPRRRRGGRAGDLRPTSDLRPTCSVRLRARPRCPRVHVARTSTWTTEHVPSSTAIGRAPRTRLWTASVVIGHQRRRSRSGALARSWHRRVVGETLERRADAVALRRRRRLHARPQPSAADVDLRLLGERAGLTVETLGARDARRTRHAPRSSAAALGREPVTPDRDEVALPAARARVVSPARSADRRRQPLLDLGACAGRRADVAPTVPKAHDARPRGWHRSSAEPSTAPPSGRRGVPARRPGAVVKRVLDTALIVSGR